MFNRIYIKELQNILQYKDRRSVKSWCKNNKVRIFYDKGSNRYFVLKSEFEDVFNKYNVVQIVENNKACKTNRSKEADFLSILLNL